MSDNWLSMEEYEAVLRSDPEVAIKTPFVLVDPTPEPWPPSLDISL